jgi:WXXGXW repeat (2 copies)
MRAETKLATHYLIGNQRTAAVVSVGNREGTLNGPLPQASDRTRFRRPAARIALASVSTLLLAFAMLATPATSSAAISFGISVTIAPPAMPVYAQPICPGPGYLWTPGYWAYDPVNGYYWVPGTWVTPPAVGLLWTPGYWGWGGGAFLWHAGYWGPTVGFYGGINYGFGYTGVGFFGGYWNHGAFFYNRAVNNVNVTNITNVYNKTVVNNIAVNHVSYNGGAGGISAQATAAQLAAARASHYQATAAQAQQEQLANSNRAQWASVNHGAPTVAATARPGLSQAVEWYVLAKPVLLTDRHQPRPPQTGPLGAPQIPPVAAHGL